MEKKYGLLTVLETYHNGKYNMYTCRCECGSIGDYLAQNVKRLHTRSCGCLAKQALKERSKTHGMTHTRLYRIWYNMKKRCNNVRHHNYKWYGGRGITYEKRWEKFESFRDDMIQTYISHITEYGEKDTTLDRIDNDANYSKDNCKWSTMKEQCSHRRLRETGGNQ